MVISNAPASSVTAVCSPISAGPRAVITAPASGACMVASKTRPEMMPLGCAPAGAASTRTAMLSTRAARGCGRAALRDLLTSSCCRTVSAAIKKTVRQELPEGEGDVRFARRR